MECEFAHETAISSRATFLGFVGKAANGDAPRVHGSGTTITLVADDLAGLFQDTSLTNGDGVFFAHNKGDAADSQGTSGRETDESLAAAGTYQIWRVEVARNGDVAAFINRELVFQQEAALNPSTLLTPIFDLESTSAAVKSVDIARFVTWGQRP